MKNSILFFRAMILLATFATPVTGLWAQDETAEEQTGKPARSAFGSPILIDNQTDVVNIAKTLEWNIQHRFGIMENGASDLYGVFAPSNIRLGVSYTPVERLGIGFGLSKIVVTNPVIDLNLKYKIIQQMQSGWQFLNVTYFGTMAIDTRNESNFAKGAYRLSYFHELIFSRRISSKFSAMVAPMVGHFNAVDSLYDNDIFGVNFGAKFKVSPQGSIQLSWTQPTTFHNVNEAGPKPGISLGYEIITSSHAFQFFISTYRDILPQYNLVYNTNTFVEDEGEDTPFGLLIGFNLTRLWNF